DAWGEPVRERLDEDRGVVVMLLLERAAERVHTDTGRHGEGADEVCPPAPFRRHEVGERLESLTFGLLHLLAQRVERGERPRQRRVRKKADVVAVRVRTEEPVDASRGQEVVFHDAVEERLRVREELSRLLAYTVVLEELGIPATELPRVEKRRPVDERHEVREWHVVQGARAHERRNGDLEARPVEARFAGSGARERQERFRRPFLVLL